MEIRELPILIPTHKRVLDHRERLRLEITMANNKSINFILPQSIVREFRKQNFGNVNFVGFSDSYFRSVKTYNAMLLNEDFWKVFSEFEQVVICQTDAILIKNLSELGTSSYDYIGARWGSRRCRLINGRITINSKKHYLLPYRRLEIGNGGLSVRRVKTCISIIRAITKMHQGEELRSGFNPEDIVFGYFLKKFRFALPSPRVVKTIFMEDDALGLEEIPDVYGFHDLQSKNLELESKIFRKFSKL